MAGTPPAPDDDPGTAGDDPAGDAPTGRTSSGGRAASAVDTGAGWVLGLLLWGWVGLPFLKGGPAQVKKTLMAKFLNKAPDGSFLP